jgi:hypothetical protein
MVPGCVPFKIVSDSPTLHSRWLLFFKVMIISFWNLLQYHSIVRWAVQAQWAEPLVERGVDDLVILFSNQNHPCYFLHNFKRDTPRDHICQVWLHLAKLFQRRRFFNISQSEKRIILGSHVLGPIVFFITRWTIQALESLWFHHFLAHLTQRAMWGIAIVRRPSVNFFIHLVIKKTNWSYVKTMSCSGSHLGITINKKNTKFVKDLPMIDAQFRFN